MLPPEDRTRSRFTGYLRAHWEAVADHLLASVVPYACRDFAQFRLPGRTSWAGVDSDGLEGFARTFLLAGFRIAGARGAVAPELIERYAAGLSAGTDPGHGFAWPAITDRSQPIVEAASIALVLAETRPWLYDRLDPQVQQRVIDWLAGIVGRQTWPCNWVLFQVIVEQFLASVGGPHKPDEIAAGLAAIEQWYVGDGWYTDGAGQHYDHYVGWAMHLYPLLWTRMSGDLAAADTYRSRLRAFLDDYQHFFAANGAPMHQGRSLTYRFAAVAPLWMGALADATPLRPGVTRRIASGALRHFVDRGVPDERGLLRLGWHRPFLPVTQPYSGPASPYWSSKAFVGLLLPPDHPVWTDNEEPAPIDTTDTIRALSRPGWLLHATHTDGIVRLVNHGSDAIKPPPEPARDDPHYAKFGYSTHAAPETGADAWLRDVDGHLAVIGPDGTATRRRRIGRIGVHDRFAASSYADGQVTVETASVLCEPGEVRIHRVTAPAGYAVRDGGYALADERAPDERAADEDDGAGLTAVVRIGSGLTSAIVGLHGWDSSGVSRAAGANAYGPLSASPYLFTPTHPGGVAHYASLVTLTGATVSPDLLKGSLSVTVEGEVVAVRFTDGETVTVRLGDAPRYTRRLPGGPQISWDPTIPPS